MKLWLLSDSSTRSPILEHGRASATQSLHPGSLAALYNKFNAQPAPLSRQTLRDVFGTSCNKKACSVSRRWTAITPQSRQNKQQTFRMDQTWRRRMVRRRATRSHAALHRVWGHGAHQVIKTKYGLATSMPPRTLISPSSATFARLWGCHLDTLGVADMVPLEPILFFVGGGRRARPVTRIWNVLRAANLQGFARVAFRWGPEFKGSWPPEKPHKFICCGDIHGTKPNEFTMFSDIHPSLRLPPGLRVAEVAPPPSCCRSWGKSIDPPIKI
jgi:hypothetical protein